MPQPALRVRTAREKLGIKPKKEGFGAAGQWVWPPPSHLRLVVDNECDDRVAPDNVAATRFHKRQLQDQPRLGR
jgi:hypothetical protein